MLRLRFINLVLVRNSGLVSLQYALTINIEILPNRLNNHDISQPTYGGLTTHQFAAARRLGNDDLLCFFSLNAKFLRYCEVEFNECALVTTTGRGRD